jgi:hypothetical protein
MKTVVFTCDSEPINGVIYVTGDELRVSDRLSDRLINAEKCAKEKTDEQSERRIKRNRKSHSE